MVKEYDYIVIGGGSGGIASANRAAMHGAKVIRLRPIVRLISTVSMVLMSVVLIAMALNVYTSMQDLLTLIRLK